MRITSSIVFLIVICVFAVAAGCTSPQTTPVIITPDVTVTPADTTGTTDIERHFLMIPQSPLNASETEDALFLQESEKLSHDLNVKLYGMHNDQPVFLQIANASKILVAVDNVILTRYGLANPENAAPGVFTNSALQNMYTNGVNSGLSSSTDALKSSAGVEDMHIADLSNAMGRTDNNDLLYMYRQELASSRNNLRSLSERISAFGQTYTPRYITLASYASIICPPVEQLTVQ